MRDATAIVVGRDPEWLATVAQALSETSIDVLATTTSLREVTRCVERVQPALAVLEITVEEGELVGLDWLAETVGRFPALRVIVLSSSEDPDDIEAAFAAGASAYVVKRANPSDVAAAARQLSERSFYLARDLQPVEPSSSNGYELTRREVEILRLAAEGLTNNQIAGQLWVTVQTVKFHLANAYRKLGVSNRTEASRWAQRHGLLLAPAMPRREQTSTGSNRPASHGDSSPSGSL